MNFFLKLNYYRKYKLYQKLIKQQNGLCYVSETLIDLEIDFKKITVEYIKPLDEGGKNSANISNGTVLPPTPKPTINLKNNNQ